MNSKQAVFLQKLPDRPLFEDLFGPNAYILVLDRPWPDLVRSFYIV